jgi:curved DNA-binding protein CbpA
MTRTKEKNPYEVLKINEDASDQEITKRFRDLARELHPDNNGTRPNEEEFKEVSSAYERLTRNRKQCDEELAQARRKAETDRQARAKAAARRRRRPNAQDAAAYSERLKGRSPEGRRETTPSWPPTPPQRPPSPFGGSSGEPPKKSSATEPLPRWPTPERSSPRSSVTPSGSHSVASKSNVADDFAAKIGRLIGALAFTAAPFGVMAIFIPIFNGHKNLLVGLIELVVGPGCFAWLCVGVVLVLSAIGGLFSDD